MNSTVDFLPVELIPVVQKTMQLIPPALQECFVDLLEWSRLNEPSFAPVERLCQSIDELGLGAALDALVSRSPKQHDDLSRCFASFLKDNQEHLISKAFTPELPIDLQTLAVKWLGDRYPIERLLLLLDSTHVSLKWWAAYHLAHIDAKETLLAGSEDGPPGLGEGVRRQVLEVVVRQALAGAPWQEICASPMRMNRISPADVLLEMLRRGGKIGFHIEPRHVELPAGPIPKLEEEEYHRMWRRICSATNEVLSWSCPVEFKWQRPEQLQTDKVLLDCVSKCVNSSAKANWDDTVLKWNACLRSTGTDKARAEIALLNWYAIFKQPAPDEIIWCSSPSQAASRVIDRLSVEDLFALEQLQHLERRWSELPGINLPLHAQSFSTCKPFAGPGWESLRAKAGNSAPVSEAETVRQRSVERLRLRILEAFRSEASLRQQESAGAQESTHESWLTGTLITSTCFAGQFEADWLAQAEHFTDIADYFPLFTCLYEAASSCGFWWPFNDVLIVTEKPAAIHLDHRSRLHNEEGPALEYTDGWSLYFLQGIPVAPWIVLEPEKITVQAIDESSNVEIRRVMLERYGLEKFIRTSGAQIVHEDECGTLYYRELPGDEALAIIRVVNSTPEPDGSRKEYFLRVPPHMRTAREAVAWTFNMTEEQYELTQES